MIVELCSGKGNRSSAISARFEGKRAAYYSAGKRKGEIHELCEGIAHSNFTQTPLNLVKKESVESSTEWEYNFKIRSKDCWIMIRKREPVHPDLSALWGSVCCLLERWKEEGGDTWSLRVNSSFKFHPNTLKLGQERVYRVLNRLSV